MHLDEVADLGAQADIMSSVVEDHSWQLGELSVMMQTVREMMGVQQEQLMQLWMGLWEWEHKLVAWEAVVESHLVWLQSWVELIDVDEEGSEGMMSMEVDEGSPMVLGLDLDDFGLPEPEPMLVQRGNMGGWVNRLVRIEEEPLDEVEALVMNGVPPSYDD